MTEEKKNFPHMAPKAIQVRNARVHNLKNINVDVPLNQIVGIAGVSGSGKSSLALGVLYAEGSRRYLESLSTYTRRRMTGAAKAQVDEVLYVPAALALHQRPAVPGIRSTFGTGTELLNSLRLMFSRLASHRCSNGHYVPPTLGVAAEQEILCPECGARVMAPSAEMLAFNSQGACPECSGTGMIRIVDRESLVPDESLSIDEGAVRPWQTLMWSLMKDIARDLGVRTDVPFRELTEKERDIVFNGPAIKKHMIYQNKTSGAAGEMDFTYFNAVYTVENALSKVKDEKGMKRVEKFLKEEICPECGGSRLSEAARAPRLRGIGLDEACKMTLVELVKWVAEVPGSLPEEMRPMAESICESFQTVAKRLMDLGLGYLTLDRAASTLSTGERQRMQLARAVRNRTTGVLYVLDEPSIGLHPSNIVGLNAVMHDLIADGNSVILVDHDTQILSEADWIIEMGPEAGAGGGYVIAEGTVEEIEKNPVSMIGPFLAGKVDTGLRKSLKKLQENSDITVAAQDTATQKKYVLSADLSVNDTKEDEAAELNESEESIFAHGRIHLSTDRIHTVKPLEVQIPKGRLTVVTGVSGSGKTTLILESLIPGLEAAINGTKLPSHVKSVEADGIAHVKLIDATPIGINVRSTVATYANVHDELRKIFARTKEAKELGYKAGDFSYNTGKLRCPVCDGTGQISLDVQFLPDVEIPCPECGGSRYSKMAGQVHYVEKKTKVKGASDKEIQEKEASELEKSEKKGYGKELLGKEFSVTKTEGKGISNKDAKNREELGYTLPELMEMDVNTALGVCRDMKTVHSRLEVLKNLGLGYLALGEETPSLSGGEAQRLKLASEMGKGQSDSVFIFDEPTIGLHPLDVQTLLQVFQTLVDNGATVVVIEHDLDVIRKADYIIDMGPGGGDAGGRIVACGTPEEVQENKESVTGRYI